MAERQSRVVARVRSWPRTVVVVVAVIFVALVGIRIALPYFVERQINERLARIPGYSGRVGNVRMHLWRGAYSLHDVGVLRTEGKINHPFFRAKSIDFSVAWRELVHRRIVSDIVIEQGQLVFVKGPTKASSQTDADHRWQEVIKDIFPIDITFFEVKDGLVRYIDNARQPAADVYLKNLHVVATGLRNRAGEESGAMPAQINVDGTTLGEGKVAISLAAEPLAEQPHFHLSFKVDDVNLPDLNQSLRAYANVEVGRGKFRMAAEMAGKDGGFQGYVKPFFENLDFHNTDEKDKGLGSRVWEHVVAGIAWLVKNKSRDQVGTRIPFEGRFGDPKVGMFATIANTFRHGFVRAFNPTVEGTINAENVLPNGKAANGKDVAAVKSDRPAPNQAAAGGTAAAEPRAGAPTGRPSAPSK